MKLEDIGSENLPEYQTLSPSASEAGCDGDEPAVTEYELQRQERMKRNREVLISLGLEDPKRKKT